MPDWRKVGSALTSAEATLPDNAYAPADRWIEAVAGTLALDPLEARMLALALHYKLDQRVERLFDAASECRGLVTRFHRDSGLIALLFKRRTNLDELAHLCVVALRVYYDGACPEECLEARARDFAAWHLARLGHDPRQANGDDDLHSVPPARPAAATLADR
jgi:hypothetical protein